jgi:dimethylhistidine N-methyltransferase
MKTTDYDGITLYDLESPVEDFRADVLAGLTKPAKTLPPKYFYDDKGARLFEEICELPEYYPTRTEMAILREYGAEMATGLGAGCMLVEFGSGASVKVRILLDHLESAAAYVPIDVAKTQLVETAAALAKAYPSLDILPVCADYMGDLELPEPKRQPSHTAAFFPGSTIGNLEPGEADRFLRKVAQLCGADGGLLIGVDLRKDRRILEPAYNDAQGITAAFNLNILERINRDLGADFDLTAFQHHAVYNENFGRIEMRLISRRKQLVHVGEAAIEFAEHEPVTTEYSYKYSLEGFGDTARRAGFDVDCVWTDPDNLFSVQLLRVADGRTN